MKGFRGPCVQQDRRSIGSSCLSIDSCCRCALRVGRGSHDAALGATEGLPHFLPATATFSGRSPGKSVESSLATSPHGARMFKTIALPQTAYCLLPLL